MKTSEFAADNNVARKTPDEIKKGLAEAPHVKYVVDDPSRDDVHYERYGVAIGYILRDKLYIYITELESRLAQAERERDAAVAELSDRCLYCKNVACKLEEPPCADCMQPKNGILFAPRVRTHFEWRGPCPQNTKEDNNHAD